MYVFYAHPEQDVLIFNIVIDGIIESILDKRLDAESNRYQYLVKFYKRTSLLSSWQSATSVPHELIVEYEEQRARQIDLKRHVTSWFPFEEQFVAQWHNHPFFIVSYGAGQTNKFCVVGLDTKRALTCKHASDPHKSQHVVHRKLVQEHMKKHQLVVHNRSIMTAAAAATMSVSEESREPVAPKLTKPLSKLEISVQPSAEMQEILDTHHRNSTKLPTKLYPKAHPDQCCCTDPGPYRQFTQKVTDGLLYLSSGPPVLVEVFKWSCRNNNSKCDIFYDGGEDEILNYSNKTLVSHTVLLEFLFGLITGHGDTFDGFVMLKDTLNKRILGHTGNTEIAFLQRATFIKVPRSSYFGTHY